MIIHVITTQKVVSFTAGEKLSMKSNPGIGVFGRFSCESPNEKRLASRVNNSSLPAGKYSHETGKQGKWIVYNLPPKGDRMHIQHWTSYPW